jgi:hypothetical protein
MKAGWLDWLLSNLSVGLLTTVAGLALAWWLNPHLRPHLSRLNAQRIGMIDAALAELDNPARAANLLGSMIVNAVLAVINALAAAAGVLLWVLHGRTGGREFAALATLWAIFWLILMLVAYGQLLDPAARRVHLQRLRSELTNPKA